MARYPNISDHGLIGDLQTAALVSTDGTVDWFCCPVAPDRDDYVSRQLYFPDTAILITRFMTPDGVGEVTDFMPVTGSRATQHHRLAGLLRVARGSMRFVVDIKPRFDYGRQPHHLEITGEGAIFHTDQLELTLPSMGSQDTSPRELGTEVERLGDDLRLHRT